jgi:lycopene beta-cyclase
MPDVDLLILGGGCAGLSLGLRLAELPGSGRTMILESRNVYQNDRTWCFWRHGPHRFDHLVSHSWQRMEVSSTARQVAFQCASTPYQMIPADRFYAEAQGAIDKSENVSLATGMAVTKPPAFENGRWHVSTNAGSITARRIVDTRPPTVVQASDALLWQSFFGEEIECDRPVFDPATAALMQFIPTRGGDIVFRYVLPSSPVRALIETTVFGLNRLQAADLAPIHAEGVTELTRGGLVRVLRSERGMLPMGKTARPGKCKSGYVHAGLMDGAARPSTGYAFQRIQRWAEMCAARIGAGKEAAGHAPDPLLRRYMDRLFLRVLKAHPERGPELFTRMFGDAGCDRVIRFLSDRETVVDCARIGLSLPLGLFVDEFAHGFMGSPRDASLQAAGIGTREKAA